MYGVGLRGFGCIRRQLFKMRKILLHSRNHLVEHDVIEYCMDDSKVLSNAYTVIKGRRRVSGTSACKYRSAFLRPINQFSRGNGKKVVN